MWPTAVIGVPLLTTQQHSVFRLVLRTLLLRMPRSVAWLNVLLVPMLTTLHGGVFLDVLKTLPFMVMSQLLFV